jgi:hypothetical protein
MCYLDPYPYSIYYNGISVGYSIGWRGRIEYALTDRHAASENTSMGVIDEEDLVAETLMEIIENSKELKEPTKAVLLQLVKRSFNVRY